MDLLAKIRITKFWHTTVNDKPTGHTIKSFIIQRNRNIGLWYDSSSYGIHWLGKLIIFVYLIMNITQGIALYMAKGDPTMLFTCFSVLSLCFMGVLKLRCLHINKKHWSFLIDQASDMENDQLNSHDDKYDYESDGDEDCSFSEHISSYTKNFSSISTYLSIVYWFTAIVFIISSFIEYGLHCYQGKDIKELPHVLLVWAPLDFTLLGYIVTVLAEIAAVVYCIKIHAAFDFSTIGYMIFLRGQFKLLHSYSERIGGKGAACDLSNRRDNRAHFRIKKCHNIHVTLLKSVKKLGEIIQTILGIYFFLATFTVCSIALLIRSNEISGGQIISMLHYMVGTMTQLFVYCYYGAAVFNESFVGMGEGPSSAAIWCLSSKIRREIALLLVGMSRPCRLYAGPFNSLNLSSFIQIIRAAYSYYTILGSTSK